MRVGVLLLVLCFSAEAHEWGVDTVFNFSQTEQALVFNGSTARYKLGGLGLLSKYQSKNLGTFYLGGGVGYSPDESASFLSVTASGSATSVFTQVAYSNELHVFDSVQLQLDVNHRDYDINGDLEGMINNQQLSVDAASRFKLSELIVSVPFNINQNNRLRLGFGTIKWHVDATAKGKLETGISAKTSVKGNGTEPLYMLALETRLFDSKVNFTYKNSKFSSDEETTMHEILINVPISGFER